LLGKQNYRGLLRCIELGRFLSRRKRDNDSLKAAKLSPSASAEAIDPVEEAWHNSSPCCTSAIVQNETTLLTNSNSMFVSRERRGEGPHHGHFDFGLVLSVPCWMSGAPLGTQSIILPLARARVCCETGCCAVVVPLFGPAGSRFGICDLPCVGAMFNLRHARSTCALRSVCSQWIFPWQKI
jgi:hypothetical protein